MKNEYIRSIWITGASSGVGAALSELYAKPGVVMGLLARRKLELSVISERCRVKGAVVYEYVADVTDGRLLKKLSEDFLATVGHIDIVIANAGIRGGRGSRLSR